MTSPPPIGAGSSAYHPELRRIARFLPRRIVSQRSRPLVKRVMALGARRRSDDVVVARVGDASVRLFRPSGGSAPYPAVLWIHGGGFVVGNAAQDDDHCRRLATELGAVVISVDYRLAPEHPFPAPLDDCWAALQWLAARDDVDASRIALAGMSAGGGLAAGLALRARDDGSITPAALLLVYPMLDDRTAADSDYDRREVRVWDNKANRYGWTSYLGRAPGGEGVPAQAAPARAEDLSWLPPTWIGVGSLDLFHDEDAAFAARLEDAGVAVTHVVVEGAYHGFELTAPKATVTTTFEAAKTDWLRQHLGA